MKVILNESRFESVFSELLKKEKLNIDISWYGSDVSSQGELIIKGLVKFSQGDTPRNIERIGYSQGHIFSYIKKGDELILRKISPNIEHYFERVALFNIFPPEKVLDYLDNLVKEYLYNELK